MCSVDGCERDLEAKGLCVGHYSRYKKHGDDFSRSNVWLTRGNPNPNAGNPCGWVRCEKTAEFFDLCRRHYKWLKKHDLKLEDFAEDLERGCEVCGSVEDLTIDHDHSIHPQKEVCLECYRGILCRGCNLSAGYVNDDVDRLMGLAFYLASKKRVVKETSNPQGEGRRVE